MTVTVIIYNLLSRTSLIFRARSSFKIGLLITLREPTRGMMNLAVHSERYKSILWNKEYPSIQIRTVKELLEGRVFDLPPTQSPLKNAQLVKEDAEQLGL